MNHLRFGIALVVMLSSLGLFHMDEGQKESLSPVLEKARSYENNYILYHLGYIDTLGIPNYLQDTYDVFADPLGAYSEEALRAYTDDDIKVEVEYLYSCMGSESAEDGEAILLQVIHMYKDGNEYVYSFNQWGWDYYASQPINIERMGELGSITFSIDEKRDSVGFPDGWTTTRYFEHTIL